MAKKQQPETLKCDPDKQYRVKLSRAVPMGNKMLTPRNDNVLMGAALAALPPDAVASFVEV
jgi:hypothetical protein